MAHDVFISYSSTDTAFMVKVVKELERKGIRCWYAPRDIAAGTDWADAIEKAIREAKIMVILLTEDSNASGQVLREVSSAVDAGLVLIPLNMMESSLSASLQFYLQGSGTVSGEKRDENLLVRKLVRLCERNLRTMKKNAQTGSDRRGIPFAVSLAAVLIMAVIVVFTIGTDLVSCVYVSEEMIRTELPESFMKASGFETVEKYVCLAEETCREAGITACEFEFDEGQERYSLLSEGRSTGLYIRFFGPQDTWKTGEDGFCALSLNNETPDMTCTEETLKKAMTGVLAAVFQAAGTGEIAEFVENSLLEQMETGTVVYWKNYQITAFKLKGNIYLNIADVLAYYED